MFGGPQYIEEAKQHSANLPAVTYKQMQRLQARINTGEECYPADGMQRVLS